VTSVTGVTGTGPLAAVALAMVAVLLWTAPTTARRRGGPVARSAAPALVAAGATAVVAGPDRLVPALVVGAASWAGWALWRRRRRRRDEQAVAERVRETCDHLAAELTAGRPPGDALAQVAASWPFLAPAEAAFTVGADVPDALRQLATEPGAGDLRLLAAAWQVAHRTGQGLAASVHRVAADLVSDRRTRRVVDGELASARATARLVAALPCVAWAMGSGAGGAPLTFLLGSPVGWACLAAGAALGLAGLWWIETIARDVDRSA
jgi:tight adherence protein B